MGAGLADISAQIAQPCQVQKEDICVAIAEIIPKDQEQQAPPLMPEQHFCPALKQ